MKTLRQAIKALLLGAPFSISLAVGQGITLTNSTGSAHWVIAATVFWAVALIPLTALRSLSAYPGVLASYGLGLAPAPDLRRLASVSIGVIGLFCVLALMLTLSGSLIWVPVTLACISMGVTFHLAAKVILWLRNIPYAKSTFKEAVKQLGPASIIYTGRSDGGPYQVLQWLEHIQSVASPVLIVTRHASASAALAAALPQGTPIITCITNEELDIIERSGASIVFYVNSVNSNSNVVNYRSLHHVYLGHGDSDKEISAHRVHRMYDSIFVSGPAALQRYSEAKIQLDNEQAVLVGRPQLAAVHKGTTAPKIRTILYAPTWSGYNAASNLSSLSYALPFIEDCLARGLKVIFRPHPFSRQRHPDKEFVAHIDDMLNRASTPQMLSKEASTIAISEIFNQSDAMVTDISSMIIEYLASEKPIAVLTSSDQLPSFRSRYPSTEATYLVDSPASDDWRAMFDQDPLRDVRKELATQYLYDTTGESFSQAVNKILERPNSSIPTRHR